MQYPTSLCENYPGIWDRMLRSWSEASPEDRCWLMYAANYLFRTCGMHWTLDPITLARRVPSAPEVDYSLLSNLDFVVLSHSHKDHYDPVLLSTLIHHPVRWIVPEIMIQSIQALGVPSRNVISARPGEKIDLGDVCLTAFTGLHIETSMDHMGGQRGIPAIGYLIQFGQKRWLIPGDTRVYRASHLPEFGMIDGLIAHLWLGRGQALHVNQEMVEAFGQFCLDLQPREIIITHLDEWGRSKDERWNSDHAQLVMRWLKIHAPRVPASYRLMGESFPI